MKILVTLFVFFLPLFALAEEMEVNVGDGKTVTLKYFSPKNKMAFFQVYQEGKLLQHYEGMGSYFQPFSKDNSESIIKVDLDGDGTEELITRTYWEVSSGVHVFKWSAKNKKFEVLVTNRGEQYLIFDKKSDIHFNSTKKQLLVKAQKENPVFTWKTRHFILNK